MPLINIYLPLDQQEGSQSVLARWLKRAGDRVNIHEPLVEISTDKVTLEVPAPASGTLKEILKEENTPVKPGDMLGCIAIDEEAKTPTPSLHTKEILAHNKAASQDTPELSPAVRRLIKEHNLDISKIRGTGKGGRVTHEDVTSYLNSSNTNKTQALISGKHVPHSPMRKSIARHMVDSLLNTAPHVTTVFEADLSKVIEHREKTKDIYQKEGLRLTFTAYFVKAMVEAAKQVPEVNSRFHEDTLEIFDDINVGVATALEGDGGAGLIVPVIKQAQLLDLKGITSRLQELTQKARLSKLISEEVQGGTITISNHGVSGSLFATPIIINQPQSAILGIGKLEKRVEVREVKGVESPVIRPMIYVTLTIDHRVLDGFQANKFLAGFVRSLENANAWR